jgi:hypothetical protein
MSLTVVIVPNAPQGFNVHCSRRYWIVPEVSCQGCSAVGGPASLLRR